MTAHPDSHGPSTTSPNFRGPWSSLPGNLITAPNRRQTHSMWDEWGPFLTEDGKHVSVRTRRNSGRHVGWRVGELDEDEVFADETATVHPGFAVDVAIRAWESRFARLRVWTLSAVDWGNLAVRWRDDRAVSKRLSPGLGLCARWDGDPFGDLRRAVADTNISELAALHALAGTTPTTQELLHAADNLERHRVLLVTLPHHAL